MARKAISSYADLIQSVKDIINGLETSGNAEEKKRAVTLKAKFAGVEKSHKAHDEAMSTAQNLGKALEGIIHDLELERGKIVSYLEGGEEGKFSSKLLKYGITPRHPGGKKGPRKTTPTVKN